MGMRFDPPTCPECGEEPQGTLETLPGCATFRRLKDGTCEYGGSTEVFWDGQMTNLDKEGRVELLCKGDGAHDWFARKTEDD